MRSTEKRRGKGIFNGYFKIDNRLVHRYLLCHCDISY